MSAYRLQIVHAESGKVVKGWQPGDRVETDLVDELVARMMTKKCGLVAGKGKVERYLRDCFNAMLYELKERV